MSFVSDNLELKNTENYNTKCNFTLFEAANKYIDLITYFIFLGKESLTYDDNFIYTMHKGVEVVNNIFNVLLLYTRNLEITTHYTNQCIYFYVEYINQISNKSAEFVFVNLTMQDAILYIYRKSIFEINEQIRRKYKSNLNEKKLYDNISLFNNTYNYIILAFLQNNDFNIESHDDIKKNMYNMNLVLYNYIYDIEMKKYTYDFLYNCINSNFSQLNNSKNYKELVSNLNSIVNNN